MKNPDPGRHRCRGVSGDGSGAGSDSADCGAAEVAVGSEGLEVGSERNRWRAAATLPVPFWSFMSFWARDFFLATGAGAGDCDAGAADPSGTGAGPSSSELFRMGG